MRFPKDRLEKHNFPLLFFEHEYLSNRKSCILEILAMHEKHCILVNCVSELLFRPWFIFYDKKQETFIQLFYIIFSRFHQIKTRPYIKDLRHSSLVQNVFSVCIENLRCQTIIVSEILMFKKKK